MKTTLALCLVAALLVGFASDASSQVLVGRWQFEEGSGTNTVNSVNSVNAVLEGGASFGTLTNLPFGPSGTVALGTGRYVDTMQGAPGLLPTTGSYSISAWGYITNAASGYWELVGAADNAGPTMGNSLITGYASLNLARGEVYGPNVSPYVPTGWQGGIANNAWNNFVLVNDSAAKTVTIFVNGVASVPSTYTGTPFTNPVGAWIFGGHTFFQGEIADFQFYTGVLSQTQISNVIMSGNAVTEMLWASSGGNGWLTASNWVGGSVPSRIAVAQFGTSSVTAVGIDMAANAGAQSVGAIEVLSNRATALTVTNSAATNGTLTFNGQTVGTNNNVILRNASGQSLTLADGGGGALGVALGNTNANVVLVDGAGGITIGSSISGSGQLTKAGNGTLTLSGSTANTYSGVTTVSGGTVNLGKNAGVTAVAGDLNVGLGATLLVSQSDQVSNTAAVTLSGGTILRGAGVSEVFGNLNIATGSFLDFGTGATGNLTFGTYQDNEQTESALLTINNFLPGNSFTFNSTSFTTNNVGSYFTFGTGYVNSSISNTGSTFTITAIPEPSTYLVAVALLALVLASGRGSIFQRLLPSRTGCQPPESNKVAQ